MSATTKLWDVETEQVVATFRGTVAEFSPDGTILAVGGQGRIPLGGVLCVGNAEYRNDLFCHAYS
jgi:primase-polymerase (primpol)-like protein